MSVSDRYWYRYQHRYWYWTNAIGLSVLVFVAHIGLNYDLTDSLARSASLAPSHVVASKSPISCDRPCLEASNLHRASVSSSSSAGVHDGKSMIMEGRMLFSHVSFAFTAFAERPLNANAADGSRRAARDQASHRRANSSNTVQFDDLCRDASSFWTTCATHTGPQSDAMFCQIARNVIHTCWKSCDTLLSAECFDRLHGCSEVSFVEDSRSKAESPSDGSKTDAMNSISAIFPSDLGAESLKTLDVACAGRRSRRRRCVSYDGPHTKHCLSDGSGLKPYPPWTRQSQEPELSTVQRESKRTEKTSKG